jgi:Rrf2 family protein
MQTRTSKSNYTKNKVAYNIPVEARKREFANRSSRRSQEESRGIMLFTKASEYALIAVIAISKQSGGSDAVTLAAHLKLSHSFLAKVLQSLAKAGILASRKGAGGGFTLAKPPEEIAIDSLLRAVDDHCATVFTCSAALCNCPSGEVKSSLCVVWPFMNRLQTKIDATLATTSIADLIRE